MAWLVDGAAARHEGLDEFIARADRAVAAEPGRGELWLARADLHRMHEDLPRACHDLQRAAEGAQPARPERVALVRARLLLAAGRLEPARAAAEESVVLASEESDAWLVLGDCFIGLRRLDEAACAYERAFRLGDLPPGDVLTLVEIHVRRDAPRAAHDVLEQALARVGPVTSLLLAAVERRAALGHFDRALAAVDLMAASSTRQERWLAMRGDLLVRAGRRDEAVPVYRAAQRALKRITRRRTPAHTELEQHLSEALARLGSPPQETPR